MAKELHTISVAKASSPLAMEDRLGITLLKGVANAAGGGAGQSVAVAITGLELPASYAVFVGGISQDATYSVTSKTSSGFTVTLYPRLAANTLAIGTFDVQVLA